MLCPQVDAAPSWRAIDLMSDLHLQANQPATFAAWQHHMAHTPADAVFILGDLFEVWVGDDICHSPNTPEGVFAQQCLTVLQAAAQRLALFVMHGNRDFLLGDDFARQSGCTLLADPCVLNFDGQRLLLSHGDALCLGDVDYQHFRRQVRGAAWRTAFLAKPLAQRIAVAKGLREQSESLKADGASYADADPAMVAQWLQAAQATTLIHGHTHQPADHSFTTSTGLTLQRRVLSDWDASATPPRGEVLRWTKGNEPVRHRPL